MKDQPQKLNNPNASTEPHFEIQRIYVKDLSYEAPRAPYTFTEEWKPEVQLSMETKTNRIEENVHEVVLSITATVETGKKSAFVVEVQQAGVFILSNFTPEQMHHMLGSYCPNILFPYAREVISDTVVRGGFPQLILAPVNFDMLYSQHLEQKKQEDAKGTEGKVH